MDFEQIREALKEIGLGHNESKIYLTLLKFGPSMAGRVAKEANIDRSACYDSLKALIKKGLVSYAIEANRKKFAAANPVKLKDYLGQKKELVDEVLPGLREMFKGQEEKSQVQMYKGYRGIRTVFDMLLREGKGKETLVLDSTGSFVEKMPYYAPHFIKGLEKNRIRIRHIVQEGRNVHPSKTTKVRFFPKTLRENPINTNITKDKLTFILWTDIPEAIVITNKFAAQAYRDYFEILWKNSKE